MTTVEITLPDDLARDAAKAGFLAPEVYADWLRAQLRTERLKGLRESMDRLDANPAPEMALEDIAGEVRAYRTEKRAAARR